jgi:DeoR/GlpR family transcriptional regulator of sugar metabolism
MKERKAWRGKDERQLRILSELRVHPSVRASDIAQKLGVHVETIRRDLDALHSEGKINRTYGGAMPAMGFEATLAERDLLFVEERRRIGEIAAAMISPGDVIMVDVGSTTAHFAQCLAARGCDAQVITNSCKLLNVLGSSSQVRIILCPGEYSFRQGGVAGSETTAFLERFHADKLVFSVGGITENGLYEVDPDFACVKRAMIANARTRILIADHAKFGRAVMTRVCNFDPIDHLITDCEVKGQLLDQLNLANVVIHPA